MTVVQISKTSAVDFHCLNPLNPGIRQQILLTVLYSFIAILVGRSCLKIDSLHYIFDERFLNSPDLYA